jgi:protein SDA1
LDTSDNEDIVDSSNIMSGIRRKDDYAARIEKIKAGREGRTFGSKKGSTERTSITNKVKSKKNKAFMMMVHKKDVKNKAKRSLREKQVPYLRLICRKFCELMSRSKR